MEKSALYQWMENPSLLNGETLPELQQMLEVYPYFHTGRMLYLKNLAVAGDVRFQESLHRLAPGIVDRKQLFLFVEGAKHGWLFPLSENREEEEKNSFSLIDAFLSNTEGGKEEEKADVVSSLIQSSASVDYLHWSLSGQEVGEKPEDKAEEVKLRHQDLIDSFIEEEEQRAPGSGLRLRLCDESVGQNSGQEPEESLTSVQSEEISDAAKPQENTYFTETLARIYVKQRRYEKALQIIKNLSLKYPEKNIYFADQIRFLEKLIINTKK